MQRCGAAVARPGVVAKDCEIVMGGLSACVGCFCGLKA